MLLQPQFTHNIICKSIPLAEAAALLFDPDDKFRAFVAVKSICNTLNEIAEPYFRSGCLTEHVKMEIVATAMSLEQGLREGRFGDILVNHEEIRLALARFEFPLEPFIEMCTAFRTNLGNDRFDTLNAMESYASSAAAAPVGMLMYLAGCHVDESGHIQHPHFKIYDAARQMAVMITAINILLDFKKDFLGPSRPLIYLDQHSADMFYIEDTDLQEAIESARQIPKITKFFKWYFHKITGYRATAEKALNIWNDSLPPDGRAAVWFYFYLHDCLLGKIPAAEYCLVGDDLTLTPDDVSNAIERAAKRSGLSLQAFDKHLEEMLAVETGIIDDEVLESPQR